MTADLFINDEERKPPGIPGLTYVEDFITTAEEARLIEAIDLSPWSTAMKRRVQHYGYRYNYRSRSIDASMIAASFPVWLAALRDLLIERMLMRQVPDQAIINEYQPGQGIFRHVDCEPCFGPEIVSLSLGSACVMEFTHVVTRETKYLLFAPRSVLRLEGVARFDWMHGIPLRKVDSLNGRRYVRHRRISITFRKVTFGV